MKARRISAMLFLLLSCVVLFDGCGRRNMGPADAGYCPVCNMRVSVDGEWTSEIVYSDDSKLLFESPADLVAYYLEPHRYKTVDVHRDRSRMESLMVRDYKTKERIDAFTASLVYKSRIRGPMGPDIFAFSREEEARAFAETNGGSVLRFDQLTGEMIQELRK